MGGSGVHPGRVLAASAVDGLYALVILPAAALTIYVRDLNPYYAYSTNIILVGVYAGIVVCYPFYSLLSGLLWGRTPGSLLARVRVVRSDGRPCEAWRLAFRDFLWGVSLSLVVITPVIVAGLWWESQREVNVIFPASFVLFVYLVLVSPLLSAVAAPLFAGRTAHGCMSATVVVHEEDMAQAVADSGRHEKLSRLCASRLCIGLFLAMPVLNALALLPVQQLTWVLWVTPFSLYLLFLIALVRHLRSTNRKAPS